MMRAAVLMDQFTTLNPRHDGIDNDADLEADEPTERLVPGMMNINTTPMHLGVLAAPLAEDLGDIQSLWEEIIAYRDNPASARSPQTNGLAGGPFPVGQMRSGQGIASMGELLMINPAAGNDARNMQRYGMDGPAASGSGPAGLWFPVPEQSGTHDAWDNRPGQAQQGERLARFAGLTQTFNTRSDVYAAYIVLRGYQGYQFAEKPVRSIWAFVIYDRSTMVDYNDGSDIRIIDKYVHR
jgi:hypothetical protein